MPLAKALRTVSSKLLPRKLKGTVKHAMLRLAGGISETMGIDRSSTLKIGSFGGFEVAYRRGTADESVLQDSFDHDIFFSGVPEYQPADTDIIVDIGAHIGTFSVLAASKVPRGAVFAVEACEETFNFLRVNALLNRASNLSVHHLALSDKRGQCTLYYDAGNWGHSVVSKLSDQSETVDSCSLQEFFQDNSIRQCSFIKFNCEGAEFPILLAAPVSLLRTVRKMLVLYHCDLWKVNSREDLLSHLRTSGFECTLRNCSDERGWIVAVNRKWNADGAAS